ncbi:MAG TPA: hypothetical protein VLE72_02610 [Candidatus Saccharimonadales bacterium]|nr:hypothetical protein [Candidatus Saccharimonadales bacterium]
MQKPLIFAYVITTSLGLIILKLGTRTGLPVSFVDNKVSLNLNLMTITGILFYGISFMTYIYLISKYDLGYIIPLVAAFVYILIFVASFFIFKEVFTATKIIGIGLIMAGLVFLNFKK